MNDSRKAHVTKDQCRDTGMALVLLLLILYLTWNRRDLVVGAVGIHVLNMTWPSVFRPAAVVWLGFSRIVGTVMSKVVLAIIYFVVVTPIGFVRQIAGKDTLRLRMFRASGDSVMLERRHKFVAADLERPY